MTSRREIEYSIAAENRLESVLAGVWREAIDEVVELTSAGAGIAAMRSAIRRIVSRPALRQRLRGVARLIVSGMVSQVSGILSMPISPALPRLVRLSESWENRTLSGLRGLLIGARRGDDRLRTDGRWPSLLDIARKARARAGSIKESVAELSREANMAMRRIRVVARAESLQLGASANRVVQRELGVTHYTWRTRRDNRVRDKHRRRDGRRFAWADPPSDGHPGEPYNCRCVAIPVLKKR